MMRTVTLPRTVTTDRGVPFTGPTVGDSLYRNLPDWKAGSHIGDPMLRDMGQWQVEKVQHYKCDMLIKGINTFAAGITWVVAPVDTANTDAKWIEHHWIVAKVINPGGGDPMWIASWKNFEGNIVTEVHRTLGGAKRAASSTKGDSAGQGIRTENESHKGGFTVDQMLGQIQSINPEYHLTQCNCQGYAKAMFGSFTDGLWSSDQLNMDLWKAPEVPSSDPSEDHYEKEESGLPYHRKVTVYKNGKEVAAFSGRHFSTARHAADRFINDDKYRSQQLYNSGQNSPRNGGGGERAPASPRWNLSGGLKFTNVALVIVGGPIGWALGKFFSSRQKANFLERCEHAQDDTGNDINNVFDTYDAYVGNVEKLSNGIWVDNYDRHSCDKLISDIPNFKHNVNKRVGDGLIKKESGKSIKKGYQGVSNKLKDEIGPATFSLHKHFNDNPDQLLGAIRGETSAFAKDCLTHLFEIRWRDFMTSNITQNNWQNARGLFERSGDIPLPADERNCYGGLIYFGMGDYNKALPFLQAAQKASLDPQLKGIVSNEYQAASIIIQHQNKSAAAWQEMFNGPRHPKDVNDLLFQYLFQEFDAKRNTMSKTEKNAFLEMLSKAIGDPSVAMDPTNRNINGGSVEFQRGHYEKAKKYYENALKDDRTPDKQPIRYNLALSYAFLGLFDQADKMVQEGETVASKDPKVDLQTWKNLRQQVLEMREDANLAARAFEYMEEDKFQEALDALSILHEKDKDNRDVIFNMALCNQGLGRYDCAMELLKPYYDSETGTSDAPWNPSRPESFEENLSREARLYKQILFSRTDSEVRGVNCFVDALLSPILRRLSNAETLPKIKKMAKVLDILHAVEPDALPALALGVTRYSYLDQLEMNTLKDVALWKYFSLLSPKLEKDYMQNLVSLLEKGLQLSNLTFENSVSKDSWKRLRQALSISEVTAKIASLVLPALELSGEYCKYRAGSKVDVKKVWKLAIPFVVIPMDFAYDYFIKKREEQGTLPESEFFYSVKDVIWTIPQVVKAYWDFKSIEHWDLNWAAPMVTALKPGVNLLVGNHSLDSRRSQALNASVRLNA